jgi:hypothetical protein
VAAARPNLYKYYGELPIYHFITCCILSTNALGGYTSIINLLDYPVCVLPVTTVDKKIDKVDENYKPLSELDEGEWQSCKYSWNPGGNTMANVMQTTLRYMMGHMSVCS